MKRAILFLALALTTPVMAQNAAPIQLDYTQFDLPNGLHVILHEDHSVPIVSVNVWYHVGSARERTGRTGFAHLFEHLMFMGSGHVKPGQFDEWLESVGGTNNGSTSNDRTNYWINVPSNAVELALFLESDRMGYLLDTMTPQTVDAQRDVVKNERRQRIENQPYGMASVVMDETLFPEGHPYHWPVIGYMPDLTAASYDDVVAFFKRFYAPSNASLVVAGDLNTAATRKLVEKWFGDVKAGPRPEAMPPAEAASPASVVKKTITDRVQLPRIYVGWITPPFYAPGDSALDVVANVLTGGKNSRIYKRLVYDMQIAQNVQAFQGSRTLASVFQIVATPRPGHTVEELLKVIDEEIAKIQQEAPTAHEVQRAVNQFETSFFNQLEQVGGFGGKADQLNQYYTSTGNPGYFNQDLARYRALSPADVRAAAARYLPLDRRVELTVIPERTSK